MASHDPSLPRLTLFWRTFILLLVLLIGGTLAWLHTYQILELAPQNKAIASQMAELLHVNATLLNHLTEHDQLQIYETLESSPHVRFIPASPHDRFSANDLRRENPSDKTWLFWICISGFFSMAGAAAIAQLLNRPLTQIVRATASVQQGRFQDAHLDENVLIHEVSRVNRQFNDMTAQLAQMEADRTLMLAGISHDLRTPLARIRLELELSMPGNQARDSITEDIEQIDRIIDQFMDYARAVPKALSAMPVIPIVEQACHAFIDHPQLDLTLDLPSHAQPTAQVDPVELVRILNNLLENAARYGRGPAQNKTKVDVALICREPWILITVRDHGLGVAPNTLKRLTEPFYRGDAARSQANGSGLGLAIVAKTLQRMKGSIRLSNHPQGGLMVSLRIPLA